MSYLNGLIKNKITRSFIQTLLFTKNNISLGIHLASSDWIDFQRDIVFDKQSNIFIYYLLVFIV